MQVSKDYLLRTIAGETILIPSGAAAQKFNGLVTVNAIGAFIWDVLQTPMDLEELVDRITNEYEVDADTARCDAEEFISDLRSIGALED